MIELRRVSYSYRGRRALDGVSLRFDKGEHVAVIGPNASGKTTLALMMNALLLPDSGDCVVDGVDTRDDAMHARKAVGLVFQDPESQAVARHVRDDVAFGPVNLGLSAKEVNGRVFESLRGVGLDGFAGREVSGLSGGQKQLLAIAGALAMRPSYVVMDEPTALLDGRGREAVNAVIAGLKERGMGVVVITHDMSEAVRAGRVVALDGGRVVADARPHEVFTNKMVLSRLGIEPPYEFRLLRALGTEMLPEEVRGIWR